MFIIIEGGLEDSMDTSCEINDIIPIGKDRLKHTDHVRIHTSHTFMYKLAYINCRVQIHRPIHTIATTHPNVQ